MKRITTMVLVAIALMTAGVGTQDQARLLREAINKETIDGDCKAAIEQYKKVTVGTDRALAAEALLRLAGCYQKLGDAQAREIYQRVVNQFRDVPDVASAAAKALSAIPSRTPTGITTAPIDTHVGIGWVLSTDGKRAVENASTALALHDLTTVKSTTLLKTNPRGARVLGLDLLWSPDGRHVAYNWSPEGGGPPEVRFVSIETGEVTIVARRQASGRRFLRRWTTRNEIVWTLAQRDLCVASANGGDERCSALPEGLSFGDLSVDGSQLYLVGSERLVRLDRAGGTQTILMRGFEVKWPHVSPDGRLLAFVSNRTGAWVLSVAAVTADGLSQPVDLTAVPPGAAFNRFIQWTVDGTLRFDARMMTDNVYGLRLTGNAEQPNVKLERLVHGSAFGSNPLIAPDSRHVAYFGSGGINVMNADGSGERPLGVSGVPLSWLSSDELVFLQDDDQEPLAVSIRTGTVRSLGHRAIMNAVPHAGALNQDTFQYVGARNEIVVRRFTSDRATFLTKSAGGDERALLEIALSSSGNPRTSVGFWQISPQGDRLLYVREGGEVRVRTVGRDDDRVVVQTAVGYSPSWTADGQRVVYAAVNPAGLEYREVNVDTGEGRALLEQKHVDGVFPPESRWNISRCSPAPDASFLVCEALVTTVHRFAWQGVTHDAVIARRR
jgi:hypothetical protein